MKLKFIPIVLLACGWSYAQECSFGTSSDATATGENVTTGGTLEYAGAADFDVPFGTAFTVGTVTFNLLTEAPVSLANITLRAEQNGLPGEPLASFTSTVPASQELLYPIPELGMNCYVITVDLPSPLVLQKGKYFLEVAASATDGTAVWWEITSQSQTYGLFDYGRFQDEDWSGTGYYSKVFQILGQCADSGEEQPDWGSACQQENPFDAFQTAATFMNSEGMVHVADDFTVAPNTIFHLTKFQMHNILLGGGLHNATINIRGSQNGMPGEILHSFPQKGPLEEKYNGYWPFPGIPLDIVSVLITFSFENEPIALTEGNYFIEVVPTPHATDLLGWLGSTQPGIGGYSASSFDGGTTWVQHEGLQMVMAVDGFCAENLGTDNPQTTGLLRHYPNPVSDVLHLVSDSAIDQLSIFASDGRRVGNFQWSGTEVDLRALACGVYILRLQLRDGVSQTLKIIKL